MKLQFQLRVMLDINSRTRKLCWRNGEGRQKVRVLPGASWPLSKVWGLGYLWSSAHVGPVEHTSQLFLRWISVGFQPSNPQESLTLTAPHLSCVALQRHTEAARISSTFPTEQCDRGKQLSYLDNCLFTFKILPVKKWKFLPQKIISFQHLKYGDWGVT